MALDSDDQDLLYNLAYECESHFDQLLETAQKLKSDIGTVEICADFQQRFAIWTAYLGVFARRSQCLDTRLRSLPDLQDLVARLLDILRRSLKHFLAELVKLSDDECLPEASQIQTTSLKTIDDTIARLNRLGITIRQSSHSKADIRAKRYIAAHDMNSFASLCVNAVQALYPGAIQPLKDHLSESMIRIFARLSRYKLRNENLKIRREALPTIEEISSHEAQTNAHMNAPSQKVMHSAMSRLRKSPVPRTTSDLSSVDLQRVMRVHRHPDEASKKLYKTSSIQVKQGNYPRLPRTDEGNNNTFACQWCGEPLIRKELSETNWRQHIDRDLKPYVCLFEECEDAHPAYSTYKEWSRHMDLHDWRWYQTIYLISSWVCAICGPSNSSYNSSDALHSHLAKSHGDDIPSSTMLQAISRQSKVEQPRAWNDCLLCCFTIEEQKGKDDPNASKRQIRQQKQETVKSSRKTLETAGPDHPSLDLELSGLSSDSDNADSHQQRPERLSAVARHIAAHLQVLMLLTLRFAALQSYDKDLDDDDDLQSNSVDVDEENSAGLEDSDVGRLSHLSSSADIAMRDADDEKSKETEKRDAQFLSTGLSFELTLKQYESHEAGNNDDGLRVNTWMSQIEKESDTEEANPPPKLFVPPTSLQRAPPLSSQEDANSGKRLYYGLSAKDFLQVPGKLDPPLSPPGALKRTHSMHPSGSARSRDDTEVRYGYDIEDRFFEAIKDGDVATIKSMLASGADVEMTDEFGRTPLWRAVLLGERSLIQLFLDSGASMEAENFNRQSILDWAIDKGKSDIVEMLGYN
ncbi:hypothetical protein ACQKWADRAFT_327934 [Trichoderma austrokoningii]